MKIKTGNKKIDGFIEEFQEPLLMGLIIGIIMFVLSPANFEMEYRLLMFLSGFVFNLQLISFLMKRKYPIWDDIYNIDGSGWFFAASYVFGDLVLLYIIFMMNGA